MEGELHDVIDTIRTAAAAISRNCSWFSPVHIRRPKPGLLDSDGRAARPALYVYLLAQAQIMNVPLPCPYSRPTLALEATDFDWKECHPPCQSRCSYHCRGGGGRSPSIRHRDWFIIRTTCCHNRHSTSFLSSITSTQARAAPRRCPTQRNI
ncbi:hypothetical protein LX32DRAFT_5625 [Colletotrichum zoysiae]|uniref:Uncharacterized protein n=1 Tax=Colletotrichum zoysiae TaxID=1216348 RepID=A0AAD9HUB4_9PEZI|nr:hypothetical protein LX32DRAFT_5625 [Colletotrichum zoysiae]